MLNFFEKTINIDVIIEDGNMEVVKMTNKGQALCDGCIDSCISTLRHDIYNLSSDKTVVFNLINRSRSSSGLVEDENVVVNKLHLIRSGAHCNVIIRRGLNYLG